MENMPSLYDTLVWVLSQHAKGLDLRYLKTLAWMMVGLINSYAMSLDVHFVSPTPVPSPWERRAPARLQKPRWSVALPGKTLELAMNL